jgi:hypothetical protein
MSLDAQRDSAKVPELYLCELHFASGVQRVSSWNHDLPFFGHTWRALGGLVGLSALRSTERPEYPAMDLALQVADAATLALANGPPAEYRGRDVFLWICSLNDELQPVHEPEMFWAGTMDQLRLNTGDGTPGNGGSIMMRCEPHGKDNRTARSLRLNNAQHQARWPGDTFLSRVEALSGQPQPWLSRKFQTV